MQNISEKTKPTGEVNGRACLVGEVGPDGIRRVADGELERFIELRCKEIEVVARAALGDRASGLTGYEVRELFSREFPD